MKPRILLINPPYRSDCCETKKLGFYSYSPVPSFGLAYIYAVLEKNGYDSKWIEAPLQNLSFYDIRREIQSTNPDIIGITSTTFTYENALEVAKIAKEINPNIMTVLGGVHVTFETVKALKNKFVDVVVRGEGEYTFLYLVKSIENNYDLKNIEGIAFKKDGNLITNPTRDVIKNLDELPFPPWNKLSKMAKKNMDAAIITSRGCPFQCVFCSSRGFWGTSVRFRTPENIVQELDMLVNKYKFKRIDFWDDTFTISEKRVEEICNLIKERKLNFNWTCNARVDTITKNMLKTMKEAGCDEILFGIESGSEIVLKTIKKGISITQIEHSLKIAKELDYKITASFVLGLPFENKDSIGETMKLIKKIDVDQILINPLIPLPGTEIYDNPERFGIKILKEDWNDYVQFLTETQELPVGELKKAFLEIMDLISSKMLEKL